MIPHHQAEISPDLPRSSFPDMRFFVLGAQKCATSWLYYCLRDHPDISLPDQKVERAYLGGPMFRQRGSEWYFSRFRMGGGTHGEVAVDYLMDGSAPTTIARYSRDPRFVVLVRDPVDRLVSAYYWAVRCRQLPNAPIGTAIAPLLRQRPGLEAEFDDPALDELVRRGLYGKQISQYLRHFEPSRFLVIAYREVLDDPSDVVRRVFRHVGVDSSFVPGSLDRRPKRNTYNRMLISLDRRATGRWLVGLMDRVNQLVGHLSRKDPPLSESMRRDLRRLFQPGIRETREVLAALPPSQRPADDILAAW